MSKTITNQAHVSFSYEGSTETRTNDSNIVSSSMKDRYDFSVEKTATIDCFRAGDHITFFVHITNLGCGCLGRFEISDNLGGEDYMEYVEGSARIFVDGSMNTITPTSTSPLEFEIEERLEREEELILQYTVIVDEDLASDVDEITNEVRVKAYPCCSECNGERNGKCLERTATYTLTKCQYAEVLITKTASSDNFCCDDEVDYFITLTNTGNVDATNIIVTDNLPTGFVLTEVHKENNGVHYKYDSSEYDVDGSNLLTLPNATGTPIYVPSIAPGVDNTTRIRLHGHM